MVAASEVPPKGSLIAIAIQFNKEKEMRLVSTQSSSRAGVHPLTREVVRVFASRGYSHNVVGPCRLLS
jgi:hypothetical protein